MANATATTPTRYAIEFGKSLIKNKVGTMYFETRDSAHEYATKSGIDTSCAQIVGVQTKLLNTKADNDAHNVPTTEGRPKGTNQTAVENNCHVKNTTKSKKWDTLYCVVGVLIDDQGENVPKVVHVLSNSADNAKDTAEYKYDMVPLAVMEGRLKGSVKEFLRQAITAIYADAE